MVFLGRCVGFFLREGNFTAWRGRNFSHAMRLEGCKRNFAGGRRQKRHVLPKLHNFAF